MDEKSKRAVQSYLDTLKTMEPDEVLLERILKAEKELNSQHNDSK
jgi:hypothetical protein